MFKSARFDCVREEMPVYPSDDEGSPPDTPRHAAPDARYRLT